MATQPNTRTAANLFSCDRSQKNRLTPSPEPRDFGRSPPSQYRPVYAAGQRGFPRETSCATKLSKLIIVPPFRKIFLEILSATAQKKSPSEFSLSYEVSDMLLSLTGVLLSPIERPPCMRCRTRMNLASIAPRPDHSEKRAFKCPKCHFIETVVVPDPIRSEEINRLADNVKPPE